MLETIQGAVLSLCLILGIGTPAASAETNTAPQTWQGRAVYVTDGDTITVRRTDDVNVIIRLYGIDAPEKAQNGGPEATEAVHNWLRANHWTVKIKELGKDRYGRTLAIILNGCECDNLNKYLVAQGRAWTYERYCRDKTLCEELKRRQHYAQGNKNGLWADPDPTPPWIWRKRH